jgi:hypothetical protein
VADNPFVSNEFLCAFSELADTSKKPMEQGLMLGRDQFERGKRARAAFDDAAMTI